MRGKNTTDFSTTISKALSDEYESRKDKDTNYNQRNFAHDLKIDYSLLSHYMVGDRTPSLENLEKIRSSLNCSFDYLLGIKQSKDVNPTKEEKLIDEICSYTGLSKNTINNLHSSIDEELIKVIDTVLNADSYTYSLLNSLYDFFTIQSDYGAFVFPSMAAYQETEDNKIVIDGIAEDFYDGFDGKLSISKQRYERLKLEVIMDLFEEIKKHTPFHLQQLVYQQKTLRKEIKEATFKKNCSKSLLNSMRRELNSIENEIESIEAFIKERDNNGKK